MSDLQRRHKSRRRRATLRFCPTYGLKGIANLLIMPNLDAADIAFNLLKMTTDSVAIGPMLLDLNRPAHILTGAATVRRIVNMTAVAAVDAQTAESAEEVPASLLL